MESRRLLKTVLVRHNGQYCVLAKGTWVPVGWLRTVLVVPDLDALQVRPEVCNDLLEKGDGSANG